MRTFQPNFLHNNQKYAYILKSGVTYANECSKDGRRTSLLLTGSVRFRSRCIMGYHTVMGMSEAVWTPEMPTCILGDQESFIEVRVKEPS